MATSLGDLLVGIGLDMGQFNSQINTVNSSLNNIGGGSSNMGKSLNTNLTKPIVDFGKNVIISGMNFEQAMANVNAISGATDSEFLKLNDTAKQLGKTTVFSATEAAGGMKYLAMAGWKTNEIIAGMPGLLALASAGQTDLATTSDIVSDVMTAFGMSASESGHFADVFAKAATSTNTNVKMMGETLKYAAPVAKVFGMSIEETSAVLGVMANNGIKASSAGTAIRGALLRMAAPPKQAAEALDELGLSFQDTEGKMKPIRQIITELKGKFDGLQNPLEYAKKIFGVTAASAWVGVLEGGVEQLDTLTESFINSEGAAQEMADIQLNTLQGATQLMESAFEGLSITLSEQLAPYLRQLVEVLTETIGWFESLNPSVQGIIMVVVIAAAAIGPLIIGFNMLTIAIGMLLSPITLIVAGLAVFGVAVYALWQTNEDFRSTVTSIWDQISATLGTSISGIGTYISELDKHLINIQQAFVNLLPVILPVTAGILASAAAFGLYTLAINAYAIGLAIYTAVTTIATVITGAFAAIVAILTSPIFLIIVAIGLLVAAGVALYMNWDKIGAFLQSTWNTIVKFATDTFNNIKNWIITTTTDIWASIVSTWENIKSSISNKMAEIWNAITTAWSNIVSTISAKIAEIVKFFYELPGNILSFLRKLFFTDIPYIIGFGLATVIKFFMETPGKINKFLTETIVKLITWGKSVGESAKKAGIEFIANTIIFFQQLPGKIWKFLVETVTNLIKWRNDMINKAISFGTTFINIITTFFSELPGKIWNFFVQTVTNVIKWRNDMINKAISFGTTFINIITTFFAELPDKIMVFFVNTINNIIAWKDSAIGTMRQIGTDLIQGLISGVTGMVNNMKESVASFASSFTQGFRDALGIKSPSKVMAEVGEETMEGFIKGLKDSITDVESVMSGFKSNIVSKFEDIGNVIAKALVNQYKSAKEAQATAISDTIKDLKRYADDSIKEYDRIYKAQIRSIGITEDAEIKTVQDQIDRLNRQTDTEKRNAEEAKYASTIAEKQKAMENAKTAEEWTKLYGEIKDMETEHARKATLEQRALQIDAWNKQIEAIKGNAEEKRIKAEEENTENKRILKVQFDDLVLFHEDVLKEQNKHFDTLMESENLKNEAQKLLTKASQDELVELIRTYYPEWLTAGTSLGQQMLNGIMGITPSIHSEISSILSAVQTATSALTNMSGAANAGIINAKKLYQTYESIGDIKGMQEASGLADKLRGMGGTIGANEGIPSYAVGTAFVPNDGLAYLHKGESVIPAGGNGGGINFYISGNNISSNKDLDVMMQKVVRILKTHGVK